MRALRIEQWVIVVIMGLLLLSGIQWGLPDGNRSTLLLAGLSLTNDQIDAMNALRDESVPEWARAESQVVKSPSPAEESPRARSIDASASPVLGDKSRLLGLRDYILSSCAVDEMYVPQCLARMDPSRFDFDPKQYIYGGAYLYPIGAALFALRAVGLLHSTTDFSYYIRHPSEVAYFYMPGRVFNLLAFISILILLGRLGNSLSGALCGTLSMLAFACSSLALNYSVISKPHIYVAFWSLLALFSLYQYINDNEKRSLIISIVAVGLAVGSSLPAGVLAVMFPALLLNQTTVHKGMQKTLLALLGVACVFLFFNPYAILSYDKYIHGVRKTAEDIQFAGASVKALTVYLREAMLRSYPFPVSLAGLAAVIWACVAGRGFVKRVAFVTAALLLFVGLSLGQTRLTLFMGPLLCLFSGIGLSKGTARLSRPLRIGVISLLFVPGIYFTALFARDTVFDYEWYGPTAKWIASSDINSNTTIGVFRRPTPVDTPPFPFINATLIDMNLCSGDSVEPDYVIIGNYSVETLRAWSRHPMRSKYSLIRNLGYRPSYDWSLSFRERSQSRISGFVFERKDRRPES